MSARDIGRTTEAVHLFPDLLQHVADRRPLEQVLVAEVVARAALTLLERKELGLRTGQQVHA